MEAQEKAAVLHDVIERLFSGGKEVTAGDWREFVEAQNDGYRTGPAIGEQAPAFALPDQHGQQHTLQDEEQPTRFRIDAVKILLERGFGKPPQEISITSGGVASMSDDELDALPQASRDKLQALSDEANLILAGK